MIEEAESETYYYHYDALGSVVALSDSSGDTVQTYEYSVYGQVAVEDANHPNPYMFAGRRYDIEIGQYYNRARYYNPYTGRFLQSDPSGYSDGMNLYAYCSNNPLNFVDPSGLIRVAFYDPTYEDYGNWGGIDYSGQMEAWADDTYFDYSFAMNSPDDVWKWLGQLVARGFEITEVFFFDHCDNSENPNTGEWDVVDGLEFGDKKLYFADGGIQEFCETLWAFVGDGGEYHFRHCFLGAEVNDDKLKNMAEWTKGLVTGATMAVQSLVRPEYKNGEWIWTDLWYNDIRSIQKSIDVPDYYSAYRFALYIGDGIVWTGTYSRDVAPQATSSTTY